MQTCSEKRAAAIDVGSNSIKMLAVQGTPAGFSVLLWHSITVRLQSGLRSDNTLDEAALQRAEDAIAALADMARELGIERIKAYGTSALRDARNASELVQRVKDRSRVELTVISGEEEAAAAYAAVAPAGRAMVVNPGGGSTEMILGEDGRVIAARSAHIGAVSLMKEAQGMNPIEIIERARAHLRPEWEKLGVEAPDTVIASGGAATCSADVLVGKPKFDPSSVGGFAVSREMLQELLDHLFPMSIEERIALPGMNPQRADILPYGIAILLAFMQLSGTRAFHISDRGNLYGFVQNLLAE